MPLSVLHAPPNRATRRDYSRAFLVLLPCGEGCYMLPAHGLRACAPTELPPGEARPRARPARGDHADRRQRHRVGHLRRPLDHGRLRPEPGPAARPLDRGRAADPVRRARLRRDGGGHAPRGRAIRVPSRVFSPLWGFLYGWTFLLAINTGFVAAVSVAFAKYLGVFLPGVSEGTVLFAVAALPLHHRAGGRAGRDRRAHLAQHPRAAHGRLGAERVHGGQGGGGGGAGGAGDRERARARRPTSPPPRAARSAPRA